MKFARSKPSPSNQTGASRLKASVAKPTPVDRDSGGASLRAAQLRKPCALITASAERLPMSIGSATDSCIVPVDNCEVALEQES